MADIMDFVKMAAGTLGQSEGATQSATGALLGAIQQKAEPGDFQQLLGALPGASGLLGKAGGGGGTASGGLLGGVLSQASSALGGNLGQSLGILSAVQGSGFSMDKIGPLVKLFLNFAKSNAGEGLVQKLMGQVPELAKLAG